MKPFFLFLLFTCTSALFGQPVLQEADLPANSLNLQLVLVTNNGSSDPSTNGADVTWDFTTAQLAAIGSVVLGPSDMTPHAATYPNANLATTFSIWGEPQVHNYFRTTPTAFEMIAEGVPDDAIHYSDPQKLIQFPFNYQDAFSDPYQTDGGSSGNITWSYAGYGTVISDLGTVADVAKLISSDQRIIFWHTDPLYPFIMIQPGSILVLTPSGVGVDERPGVPNVQVHPNPFHDMIRINGMLPHDRYAILDPLGREILNGIALNAQQFQVQADHLAPGNYILAIRSPERSVFRSLIKY